MNKIHMFWYKVPFGKKNFGDELGPYIVNKLSDRKIQYMPLIHPTYSKINLKTFLSSVITLKIGLRDIIPYITFLVSRQNVLISIGSIISWHSSSKCDIWGAGIMARHAYISNANFLAVRGKYTQLRLKELGYSVPETIGDPALLTPLLYNPQKSVSYDLGIIPHHFHYTETINKIQSSKIKVINLLDNIEKVIDDIKSCKILISSSLHGLIIGHAYNIPTLWYSLSNKTIGGDDIKFADYFSSVALFEYQPFQINDAIFDDFFIKKLGVNFNNYKSLSLINQDNLKTVQKNLIKAAPFKVLGKFA